MHGQEIAEEIKKRKGSKPSPGTIYPALKNLKEAKLIEEKTWGKKIVYSLTKEGFRTFRTARQIFCKTFTDII